MWLIQETYMGRDKVEAMKTEPTKAAPEVLGFGLVEAPGGWVVARISTKGKLERLGKRGEVKWKAIERLVNTINLEFRATKARVA